MDKTCGNCRLWMRWNYVDTNEEPSTTIGRCMSTSQPQEINTFTVVTGRNDMDRFATETCEKWMSK